MFISRKSGTAVWVGFQSKKNASNVRVPNLLKHSRITDVFTVNGLSWGKLDRVVLLFLKVLKRAYFKTKLTGYQWIHVMSTQEIPLERYNQVLHLDDPLFTNDEQASINAWHDGLLQNGRKGLVVVTFNEMGNYLKRINPRINFVVIEQGFTKIEKSCPKNAKFSFVYSSPYIDFYGDKNENHPTWSGVHLLEDLIPLMLRRFSEAEIHLIGRLGRNANRFLDRHERIIRHGLVTPIENARILSSCHVALYPRKYDHGRRVLKISEYMGAELPVVAYRVEDTQLVQELGIGLLASNSYDFMEHLNSIYCNSKLREDIEHRIRCAKKGRDWETLAVKLDDAILAL